MTKSYPSRPVVGVGGVVLVDSRVVLVKRRFDPLAGQWTLPGGTLELGETLQAGLTREIREETGLEVEVGPVLEVLDRIERDHNGNVEYHFVLVDYLCRPRGGRLVAGSDAAEVRLVPPDQLTVYEVSSVATAVIERAVAMSHGD